MSWTLFAQLFILIILVYLCIRALLIKYYEEKVVVRKLLNEVFYTSQDEEK